MNRNHSIRYRCSVAVQLIDTVTGGAPATSGLKLILGLLDDLEQPSSPRPLPPRASSVLQPKGGGYYAASGLEPGHYTLTVQSPHYMAAQIQWTLQPDVTIPFQASLRLLPAPAYPYAARLTRIQCRCLDDDGKPVAGAELLLHSYEAQAGRARLRREASAGATELYVRAMGTSPVGGAELLLLPTDSSSEERSLQAELERVQIAYADDEGQNSDIKDSLAIGELCWKLHQPLQHSYPVGTALLTLTRGRSDARGEALLVLPSLPGGVTDYELSTDKSSSPFQTHLTLKEGEALRVELNMISRQAQIRTR